MRSRAASRAPLHTAEIDRLRVWGGTDAGLRCNGHLQALQEAIPSVAWGSRCRAARCLWEVGWPKSMGCKRENLTTDDAPGAAHWHDQAVGWHEQPLTSTEPGFGVCSDSRMEATMLIASVKPRLP